MRLPAARRLTGKGTRLRSEKFGVRIPSGRPNLNLAVVADRQMHLTVYQDQAGSIPVHRANGYWASGLSPLTFNQETAGSNPVYPATGAKLIRMSMRLLIAR